MLNLEIISPEKVVFTGSVGMAVVPAEEGEVGILPKHSPIVAQLRAGELQVFEDVEGKKLLKVFSIAGGFLQTDGETCLVLSEEVDLVEAA